MSQVPWSYRQLWAAICVLGIELGSFGRTINALNCWVNPPAHKFLNLLGLHGVTCVHVFRTDHMVLSLLQLSWWSYCIPAYLTGYGDIWEAFTIYSSHPMVWKGEETELWKGQHLKGSSSFRFHFTHAVFITEVREGFWTNRITWVSDAMESYSL